MRVHINKIILENTNIIVLFSTDFGDAKAFWEGEVPTINSEYQVEVDIIDTLVWNIDIIRAENDNYSIQMENEFIHISGKLDSVDDDGYTVLRIGDNIIPFVATGEPFHAGTFISVSSKLLSISPVSY